MHFVVSVLVLCTMTIKLNLINHTRCRQEPLSGLEVGSRETQVFPLRKDDVGHVFCEQTTGHKEHRSLNHTTVGFKDT